MRIGGFQKFSAIDFPGKFAAIVFTQGCNFRCPFCHNPELVLPKKFGPLIPEREVLKFLETRKGKLEGVEITGGEPTLQPDLKDFIKKINIGFLVKLDSNGSNPEVLEEVLPLVDYVAMDIKAPLEKYSQLAGVKVDTGKIMKSIDVIKNSGIEYEFRNTFVRPLLEVDDFKKIGELVQGAKKFVIQKFVHSKHVSEKANFQFPSDEEMESAKKIVSNYIEEVIIRS